MSKKPVKSRAEGDFELTFADGCGTLYLVLIPTKYRRLSDVS